MPPSKNQIAATLTRGEALKAGVIDASGVQEKVTSMNRRMSGFTRKILPPGLPEEPVAFIYSMSDYGELVDLGPGFPRFQVTAHLNADMKPIKDEDGDDPWIACPIKQLYFFEEVKVDVTEHTPFTAQQIVDAVMKRGPGINQSLDRSRVGWFVSEHNPPKPEEIERATIIFTQECQRLFNVANAYAAAGKLQEINEEHRRALRFLGQKADWDKPQVKMIECPSCGERVRAGIIWHATPMGCGYIFDQARYDKHIAKQPN